jgi:hypothetical protein
MQRRTTAFSGFLFLLLLALAGLPGAPAARAATGREPVIIIPGVAGSELTATSSFNLSVSNGHGGTYAGSYSAGEKVWVNTLQAALPGSDDYFDALKLKYDAATAEAPLAPSGLYGSVYGDIVDYLKRQGYVEGVDLWVFPYDWRQDIRVTLDRLDSRVTQALVGANGGRTDPSTWTIRRADLVGHSMGGLVGRAYVSDPAHASRIDQLITLGSPQLGAAKFLKTLMYGDTFGPYFLGIGLEPSEISDVVQNMPGPWQLLPSSAFYSYYNNSDAAHLRPYVEDRDVDGDSVARGALDYSGVKSLLLRLGKNPNAQARAESYHTAYDTQRQGGVNGVRWAALVGHGYDTLGQLRDYTSSCLTWTGYKPCPAQSETPVDGDGTVAIMSAAMGDPWSSAPGGLIDSGAQRWYVEREHTALVEYDYVLGIKSGDGPVLPWLGGLLSGATPMGAAAGSAQAATADTQAGLQASKTRVSRTPPAGKLRGTLVSGRGAAALEVRAAGGAVTGRARGSDKALAQAEGSSYSRTQGGEAAFIRQDQRYDARLVAEQDGALELRVRMFEGGRLARTAVYPQVLVRQGGSVSASLPQGLSAATLTYATLPVLQIDADGDGFSEATAPASALLDERQSLDTVAPEVRVPLPQAGAGQATVRWTAADALSGLAVEQGVIDPDGAAPQTVRSGQTVALAPGPHTLQVLAQDHAGNAAVRTVAFTVASPKTPDGVGGPARN